MPLRRVFRNRRGRRGGLAFNAGVWADFGTPAHAWSALNPANTSADLLADYVGAIDLDSRSDGASYTADWTGGGVTAYTGASDCYQAALQTAIGSGVDPWSVSLAFSLEALPGADQDLWSAANPASNVVYVRVLVGTDGSITVLRRGANTLWDTGSNVAASTPHVLTVSFDGSNTHVTLDGGSELSNGLSDSLASGPATFSIGALLRLSPAVTGDVHVRECVILSDCPDAAGRAALHARMLSRNALARLPAGVLADWDAEAAGTSAWGTIQAATLSKQSGSPSTFGSQVLRVAGSGSNFPGATQAISSSTAYRLRGYARSVDGVGAPRIQTTTTTRWDGDTGTGWQAFDVSFTSAPGDTEIRLRDGSTGVNAVEFDDVSLVET